MQAAPPYPDVEDAVAVLLATLAPAGSRLPSGGLKAEGAMPFHRVYRFAGGDDGITDQPVIGVDTFAAHRDPCHIEAERARQLLIATPHAVTLDDGTIAVIDHVTTGEGPHDAAWGDSQVHRQVATYTVHVRRPL